MLFARDYPAGSGLPDRGGVLADPGLVLLGGLVPVAGPPGGVADEGGDRSLRHRERRVADRGDAAEVLVEPLNLQECRTHGRVRVAAAWISAGSTRMSEKTAPVA